jgi:hypothetical protein
VVLKNTISIDPKRTDQLKNVIFVSVPHGGSWPALLLNMVPAARDLLPVRKHFKKFKELELPESTVNFLSQRELKVWPRKHGLLKGHIDIVIQNTNHDSIVHSGDFFNKALAFIESDFGKLFKK